jgi:hypothetical protein
MKYELYMEKFRITMWRDDSVYMTESLGCGWFPEEVVKDNRPRITGVMYVSANDTFAHWHMTIRKVREAGD